MEEKLLDQFQAALKKFGFASVKLDKSEEIPFEHLNVVIPDDEKGRKRSLIVKVDREALVVPLSEEKSNVESFVQIYSILPFSIADETLGEVARIVSFFNKSLATPGFVLDEASRYVFFRYSFLKPSEEVSGQTFISLVGSVLLYLDTFSESIEKVAEGKGMVEVLSDKVKELTK